MAPVVLPFQIDSLLGGCGFASRNQQSACGVPPAETVVASNLGSRVLGIALARNGWTSPVPRILVATAARTRDSARAVAMLVADGGCWMANRSERGWRRRRGESNEHGGKANPQAQHALSGRTPASVMSQRLLMYWASAIPG